MTVAVDPAIVLGSAERPRRRSSKLATAKSPKKPVVLSKLVPILPKPEVKAVFVDHTITKPALTVLLGAAITPITDALAPAPVMTTETRRICKLSCDQCGLQFNRQSSLSNHVKKNSCTRKKWQCDKCDKFYLSRDLLRAHVRDLHPKRVRSKKQDVAEMKTNLEKRKVNCDTCDKIFGNRYLLAAHIRRIHHNPAVDSTSGKRSRQSNVHPERMAFYRDRTTIDDDGTAILSCDHCSYRTKCRFRFYEHYRIHTGERPYTCHDCGKTFRTKAYVRKHILAVHQGVKNYPCDICGQAFSDRRFTENHRRRHTGERPYVCDLCGKTYAQSATLMVHKRFHFDERNYECDMCDKKFVRRGHLLVHLKRHNQIKDYVCELCGKAFVDQKMLKDHMTVHSQDRPFVCDLCGAKFKLKKHLVQHGRTHRKM